ncbi:MAG: hypothetical protein ACTHK7_03510 [Aureliella sp.]
MGFLDWLKRRFGNSDAPDTVPFYNFDAGSVVQIPRRELSANAIQVQIQGVDGVVWVLPDQLQPGPVKHEPFTDEIRDYLRYIQTAFSEHRELTLEEWEDGFRRDTTPEREIALWLHAADVYLQFAADEPSPDRRTDIYRCIVTCMTAGPDSVWDVLRPQALDAAEARQVVDRFYGKEA